MGASMVWWARGGTIRPIRMTGTPEWGQCAAYELGRLRPLPVSSSIIAARFQADRPIQPFYRPGILANLASPHSRRSLHDPFLKSVLADHRMIEILIRMVRHLPLFVRCQPRCAPWSWGSANR